MGIQITKVSTLLIDGVALPIKEATLQMPHFKKIIESGPNGPVGSRKGEFVTAQIKAKVFHSDDLSLAALADLTGSSVLVETEGGKLFSMSEGLSAEMGEIGADAVFDLTIQGETLDES